MEIALDYLDTLRIFRPKGEIDLSSSPDLRKALNDKTHSKNPSLLLDMSQVDFIDSSGLAVLIEYAREAHKENGKIILFGLNERIRQVFELVRLDEWFPITHTEEEAIALAK